MMLTTWEGKSICATGRGISISESSVGPRKLPHGWDGVGVMVGVEVGVGVGMGVGVEVGVGMGVKVDVLSWEGEGVRVTLSSDVIELPVMGSKKDLSHAHTKKHDKYKKKS